ncbi:MAG: hypothetical protein GY765_15540 [bacterium]|nr:hypothetical protein [bacterium]
MKKKRLILTVKLMLTLLFLSGCMLYGSVVYDIHSWRNGTIVDGLGRALEFTSLPILGQDVLWCGPGWFFLEMGVIIAGVISLGVMWRDIILPVYK